MASRLIFVTGTDTGVGKTLLAGLLLAALRNSRVHTLALKPFCSGSRADARLLRALQDRELSLDQVNPFYFPEPLAPLAASRTPGRSISMREALNPIRQAAQQCDCLLVEGIGGLLVPLAPRLTVLNLIARLPKHLARDGLRPSLDILVVSRNSLGTINHTLLTVRALQSARIGCKPFRCRICAILMDPPHRDPSSTSNPRLLAELLFPVPVSSFPYLGSRACTLQNLRLNAVLRKSVLSRILS